MAPERADNPEVTPVRRVLVTLSVIVGLLALSPTTGVDAQSDSTEGAPVPTLDVDTVVSGLDIPWGLDFAPDGTMYFTERGGGWFSLAPPYRGQPTPIRFNDSDLYVNGETGLLDLIVDPDFAANRRVYTCQGHRAQGQAPRVQVISWTINRANDRAVRLRDPLVNSVTLYGQPGRHGGCRLRFDNAKNLYIATGDGASSANPQNLNRLGGKVLRVNRNTGAGVPGNPFANGANANRRRIWSFGHRNLQGIALRPGTAAQMWTVEHGTYRDDEVNQILRGRNYGWQAGPGYDESPPMTDFSRFPNAVAAKWSSGNPTIATSGAVFLQGAQWGAWNGALAVGVLKDERLAIFDFAGGQLQNPVFRLVNTYGRLRTPVIGPGGDLFLTTANGGNDRILRIQPA